MKRNYLKDFSLFLVVMLIFLSVSVLPNSKNIRNNVSFADSYKWIPVNNGLYGGTVLSLAINSQNPAILYTGTDNGTFKTTDSGAHWKKIGLTNKDVRSLAVNPKNPQIIYAGTDNGVFKSTDSGAHWNQSGLTNENVLHFTVNPQNPQILYAGTWNGVFKSTDAGAHWNQSGLTSKTIWSLAINPQNPAILYTGIDSGGILKSTDSGGHWNQIGLTNKAVWSIAINPSNAKVIYAGTNDGVFKSIDFGTHWNQILLTNVAVFSLVINPQNPQFIYAGTTGSGVFKSTDAGIHWNQINNGLTNKSVPSIAINPQNPQIIYAGTWGGGVFKYTLISSHPSSPKNLTVALSSNNSSAILNWTPSTKGTNPIKGYAIYRGTSSGGESTTPIDTVNASITTYTDINVTAGTTYYYYIKAYDNQSPPNYSTPSNEVKVEIYEEPVQKTVITLQPDNPMMSVNGAEQEIDPGRGTAPVIIDEWSRTVVPIRAIVEALSGSIGWNPKERKVTINFNGTVINLWIDKPQAEVNGKMEWIDPNNHNVKPIIINDRTMLPLRFVAENLGCKVDWDAATRTITITYPNPINRRK